MNAYDLVRCSVCGVPWDIHRAECPRHEYGPPVALEEPPRADPVATAAPTRTSARRLRKTAGRRTRGGLAR